MAPLFWFLFIGLGLGLATGFLKHDDWLDRIADLEIGLLGAIIGGMTFVLTGNHMQDPLGFMAVALVSALMLMALLKRLISREPKTMPH